MRAEAWTMPNPANLIVAKNGIYTPNKTGIVKFCDSTPRLFTINALDYDLLIDAAPPLGWLAFLDDIFDGDKQQINLLQEWFGYVLTSDTSQQKMLLLLGPPRSGKGTIARILSRVVGLANVVAPTLAGLGTNFGLWPLIGKQLAIVSDARLSGRSDMAIITERLLSISGEDSLTIDRKNQNLVTMKLLVRFLIISNELPRLADASGAMANRFLILYLRKSYLGSEDTSLTDKLASEVPYIASWAIYGLMRLRDEGRFTEPVAADSLRQELNDLASPIGAFLREWCAVRQGAETSTKDLFDAWRFWCFEQGRRDHGSAQTFGRDVRAAVPGVAVRQAREGTDRIRTYEGIGLTLAAQASLSAARAKEDDKGNRHSREESYAT